MTKKKLLVFIVIILLLIPAIYFAIHRYKHPVSPVTESTLDTLAVIEIPEPELMYGLPVDSFRIEENTVKRNQFWLISSLKRVLIIQP